ncbi:MAG: hypothetical protein PUF63_07080 [Prevotella sp.]|jgi:hypothetical protein|nr:hypothetical protein [Prevotella sp.]
MKKRLQNRVALSRWALPVTIVYGLAICLIVGMMEREQLSTFVLLVVSSLMMAELNNSYSLIRIYSRMVSCSFLVMTSMCLRLFPSAEVVVVQLTFIAFLLLIWRAYQNPGAVGWVFYAFLALGVSSIVFPKALLFVPVLWVVMGTNVLCLSARTLMASILGLLTPYWFFAAWLFYTNDLGMLAGHFASVVSFQPLFQFNGIDIHHLVTFGFILLLAVIGATHFIIYSYQDRIRIRLIYETFIVLDACCVIFALLQPQHFNELLGMAIVNTSPLIGHFLALTHSRLSNITSISIALIAFAITLFNLWPN